MKISELKENISKYSKEISIPKNDSEHIIFKEKFDDFWKNEIKNININDILTYEKKTSSIYNVREVSSILYKETKYEINPDYSVIFNFSFMNTNEFSEEINLFNEGDKIDVNCEIKFLNSFTLNNTNGNSQPIINIILEINKIEKIKVKPVEIKKVKPVEIKKVKHKRKRTIIEFKKEVIDYCENIEYPRSYEEHIKFKTIFNYDFIDIIKKIQIEDILTFKKPFEYKISYDNITFVESLKLNERYVIRKTDGYTYNSDIISFKFDIQINNELFEIINSLDEGDLIKIKIIGIIESIESINLNNEIQCSHNLTKVLIKVSDFVIIENNEFNKNAQSLKKELKKPKKLETKQVIEYNPNIKSFNSLLNYLIELNELKYKSKEKKSDLTTFQNEIYNKKYLDIYNSKKVFIKNLKGLDFNIICEVSEVSKENIDFTINYKNKSFFLCSRNYNKELQEKTFFLKPNSSVEIKFKMEELNLEVFSRVIHIDLISIKINNKVKLFGKFITLEYFWLSIYLFLVLFTLILFSKINFYGVKSFFLKLTLWVFFGYLINKLLVKRIYKN